MPLTLTDGTLFSMTPQSGAVTPQLTPYSARGLTQNLELLGADGRGQWVRRDVNGHLQNLADTRFRKYKSTVTCKDGETPCVDDAWIGIIVVVDCACELSRPTGSPLGNARPIVSGSLREQGAFSYYRPQLTMMVTAIRFGFQEYPSIYDWQIDLEEV